MKLTKKPEQISLIHEYSQILLDDFYLGRIERLVSKYEISDGIKKTYKEVVNNNISRTNVKRRKRDLDFDGKTKVVRDFKKNFKDFGERLKHIANILSIETVCPIKEKKIKRFHKIPMISRRLCLIKHSHQVANSLDLRTDTEEFKSAYNILKEYGIDLEETYRDLNIYRGINNGLYRLAFGAPECPSTHNRLLRFFKNPSSDPVLMSNSFIIFGNELNDSLMDGTKYIKLSNNGKDLEIHNTKSPDEFNKKNKYTLDTESSKIYSKNSTFSFRVYE